MRYKDDSRESRTGRPWMKFVGNLKRFLLLNPEQTASMNNPFSYAPKSMVSRILSITYLPGNSPPASLRIFSAAWRFFAADRFEGAS
jgi:hypothetical protein